MSKRKTSLLLSSLALAAALLVPHPALGSRSPDGPTTAVSDAGAPRVKRPGAEGGDAKADGAAAEPADETRQPKRKGNAFARVISAPFRALARLFGGGKSKPETAKKTPAPTQQPTDAVAQSTLNAEAAANVPAEESNPGKGDAAPASAQPTAATRPEPVEAPKVEPITATPARVRETAEAPGVPAGTARAPEGVRLVRPSEGEVAHALRPQMWIPKVVGVPSDPLSQGRALLQHGYIQEAVAELQTAATTGLPEQLAEANNLLGLAYDRLGWHRMAADAYGRALSSSPKDYVALTNLGYSLYLADDYMGALKRLKQAAKLAPNEPVIFNNLGVVNARLGRHGDAFKNFVKGSNEYEAHLKLAGILEDRRRDREAVKHYEAALRIQPGASAVLERLVALYDRTGARDKADTARRALSQPQKNPQKTATGGGG
ncbi:MAG TPA: tetratricopeptide repeat protein [Pyrinomonadaceae bacterium]